MFITLVPPEEGGSAASAGTPSLQMDKHRRLAIPVRCPLHETDGCTATVSVRTVSDVPGRFSSGTKAAARRVVFVRRKTFRIHRPGNTRQGKARLSKRHAAILRGIGRVRVQVAISAKDAANNTVTTKRSVPLRAAG